MSARLLACVLVAAAAPVCVAATQNVPGPHTYRVAYPVKDWALDVDLTGFEVISEEFIEEGRRLILAAFQRKQGRPTKSVTLFVTLEPESGAAVNVSASEWASRRLKRSRGLQSGSVKSSEHKGVPVFKYTATIFPGTYVAPGTLVGGMTTRVLEAYMLKDGIAISIRLGGQSLGGDEERAFLSVLDSVKLADAPQPSTSFDYYHAGKAQLFAKDYKGAANSFGVALTLESKDRQLGQNQWRDLIERAFDIFAAADDFAGAKKILEYGVASDPTNWLFHLWLARVHAAAGDLDAAIASLENAFRHSKGLPRAYPSLAPLSDPAFGHFRNDEKFRKAVKAMKK